MKIFIFIILYPIYVTVSIILSLGYGFWAELAGGSIIARLFFLVLLPFFGSMAMFIYFTIDWWMDLVPDKYNYFGAYILLLYGGKPDKPWSGAKGYPF